MADWLHASLPGSNWLPQSQPCLNSAFRDLVQSFPRPRQSARVTKPRSAGNSPSKRRTTMSYSRPAQGYQHQQFDPAIETALHNAAAVRRNRPTSWHPAARPTYSQYPVYNMDNMNNMNVQPMPTYENMLSYPTDMPLSHEPFPTFPGLQDPSLQSFQMNDWNTVNFDNQSMSDWTFNMMAMNNSIPSADVASAYESVPSSGGLTGPPTPDFQKPDDAPQPTLNKQKSEDELVGMGLYSHPEVFLDSFSGKGLKLEETFTPSADEDKNSEEDESEVSSPEQSAEPRKQSSNLLQQSFFFEDDIENGVPSGVTEQQFINMASQPCMNYGYGWI